MIKVWVCTRISCFPSVQVWEPANDDGEVCVRCMCTDGVATCSEFCPLSERNCTVQVSTRKTLIFTNSCTSQKELRQLMQMALLGRLMQRC